MDKLLSNYPGKDIPVIGIVIALFALVTTYYGLLIFSFNKSWKKLIVSYSFIIVLLIIILLISQYYLVYFKNYTETFIADYLPNKVSDGNNKNNNNSNNSNMTHVAFTQNPFSKVFNIDKMCSTGNPNQIDQDDISWKCRVRKLFNQDTFSLKTTENDIPSSVKYPLKYDGIYSLKE
jgi:hypothetical protein